jgi:hypothetical protein
MVFTRNLDEANGGHNTLYRIYAFYVLFKFSNRNNVFK